jgi:hypothetical protein
MHRDTVTRSWGQLSCHSSAATTMFQHNNAWPHVARTFTQFMELKMLIRLWPAYSPDMSPIKLVWDARDQCVWRSVPVPTNIQQPPMPISSNFPCQYPATSLSHWRGMEQHSTGHNQQPDHLYAKEIQCVALHEASGGNTR